MKVTDEELEALKAISAGAVAMSEGGDHFVYLPSLLLESAGRMRVVDALLGLTPMNGYTTRLFLSESVTERQTIGGRSGNWTTHMLFGRNWHTWSWQGVPRSQAAIQVLREHMEALK
ncbi:hypothetical protein J2W35_001322 [Variovorax boronicumulans]|uniref:hypothetical protein n=1 Tax=Variovorax boronicumulans TaxID=436515 RepID=UPI0027854767|nr:hypothetical protein [Variovorax boronicumulans]MDQ0080985.1 hypothetical protein [Variovorax boronicumulans]